MREYCATVAQSSFDNEGKHSSPQNGSKNIQQPAMYNYYNDHMMNQGEGDCQQRALKDKLYYTGATQKAEITIFRSPKSKFERAVGDIHFCAVIFIVPLLFFL